MKADRQAQAGQCVCFSDLLEPLPGEVRHPPLRFRGVPVPSVRRAGRQADQPPPRFYAPVAEGVPRLASLPPFFRRYDMASLG
jgi:hypothetical protein